MLENSCVCNKVQAKANYRIKQSLTACSRHFTCTLSHHHHHHHHHRHHLFPVMAVNSNKFF